jgi:hypothetical protein
VSSRGQRAEAVAWTGTSPESEAESAQRASSVTRQAGLPRIAPAVPVTIRDEARARADAARAAIARLTGALEMDAAWARVQGRAQRYNAAIPRCLSWAWGLLWLCTFHPALKTADALLEHFAAVVVLALVVFLFVIFV